MDNISPVNTTDDTFSIISEKKVIHATSSLSPNDILFAPKFTDSLSISKITTQNHCCAIFYPSYYVFQDLRTGMKGS